MKKACILGLAAMLAVVFTACSTKISSRKLNAYNTVAANNVSYNSLTMDIDPEPITYTIDVSTESGRAKLHNLSLDEACDLALIESIMVAKCATIFQPQYTHLMKGGKVLRVTIYGFPAHYKKEVK